MKKRKRGQKKTVTKTETATTRTTATTTTATKITSVIIRTMTMSLAATARMLTTTTSVGAFTPPTTATHISQSTKKPIQSKSTALQPKFKTFDEMLAQHHTTPILIDFYAPWCGPCKLMKMELKSIRDRLDELGNSYIHKYHHHQKKKKKDDDDMAKTLEEEEEIGTKDDNEQSKTSKRGGGIPVYHVNTNKFPQVGAKNNIHGLPTLVLFHEGTEIWRNEGIIRGEEIIKVLEERLLLQ